MVSFALVNSFISICPQNSKSRMEAKKFANFENILCEEGNEGKKLVWKSISLENTMRWKLFYSRNCMVFCHQNCSDLLWEKIVLAIEKNFEIRGWRPRICNIFEITRTIHSNSETSEQFLATEFFFNLFYY